MPGGEIDCFYVHHARQGEGIGAALLRHLERAARRRGLEQLELDASVTGMSFFRRMGFVVMRRQKKIYRGQPFRQYRMRRIIGNVQRSGPGSRRSR